MQNNIKHLSGKKRKSKWLAMSGDRIISEILSLFQFFSDSTVLLFNF